MIATKSGPRERIQAEGSNCHLNEAVVANMIPPIRTARDISVNEAGNLFTAGTCNVYHVKQYKQCDMATEIRISSS